MADKQQTITVNYQFNTVDVERAGQLLSRANQASNQLQQAGQKTGQAISQGMGQARRSITSMEIELARLKTMLEVSSDPRKVAELSSQYKVLATQIKAAKTELMGLPKETKAATDSTKSLAQQFGGLLTAVKAVFAAGAVRQLFDIAMSAAQLAGNVEGVERAFQRAIPNSVALLDELRRATHGTSTDLDLMQKTLQAKNLGIPVQELGTFFEFAAIRAQQTGVSVDYLTQSIVDGLGRKSTRVLDNLGISATRIKDQFSGMSLEQLSVAEVSRGLGVIIREEMTSMGEYIETKVSQLSTSFQKLKEEAAKAFTGEGGLIGIMKEFTDSFAVGLEAINKGTTVQELANQKRIQEIALISERVFAQRTLNGTQEENVKIIEDEIQRLTQELGQYARFRQVHQDRIDSLIKEREERIANRRESHKEYYDFQETLKLEERLRDAKREDIAIDQEILKLLAARLAAMKKIDDQEVVSTGIIERKKKEIADLEKQILQTNNAADLTQINIDKDGNAVMQVGRLVKALEIAKAELADLQRTFTGIDVKPLKDRVIDVALELEVNIKRIEDSMQGLMNTFSNIEPPAATVAKLDTFWTGMGEMWNDNWRDLVASSADFQANAINSWLDAEVRALDTQLSNIRSFYQQQQQLAGDNQRARDELRVRESRETQKLQKEIFEREKRIRRAQTVIDGAAGAIKAFATAPNVYVAIAQAALIAATTVAQLRIIDKEQPRFAKGVINLQGPGTATSDSIPARLSKGESVMTAWETKYAGDVLKDIRAKKLDNKSLREMKQRQPMIAGQQFDDTRIVKAIKDNRQPDYVEQAGIAYRVTVNSEGYRKKQRAKSIHI